ncbi:hypothetical protein [Spartinivicinus poritis]|uniref:Uncharacterized protein n=1 Tax=Spartinivicinus poritis TaxID=2994640 RepID=A0ABT5UGQ7_9GAMM|nr:hypothetical protein [Spartinivicinus sp. A2-2]MDE1465580.1 hypothetical protein [Spartinivicinus sp. A2-2]
MTITPPPLPLEEEKILDDKLANETANEFKCQQCGAKLIYKPGARSLVCQYCNFENQIQVSDDEIEELDYHDYLRKAQAGDITEEKLYLKCDACGAESTSDANVTSQACPFCDSQIVSTTHSKKLIKPRSLLPFKITSNAAKQSYKKWLNDLWFAPNALKNKAKLDTSLNGVYVPHWTYDTDTTSNYRGERGEYYYVTVTKTRTNSEGERETYTEQERRTRWYPASGRVANQFDDVLVLASHTLPRKYTQALEPWDLENLEPYQDQYLSGFKAESYQVNLEQGFELAKDIMDDEIRSTIRQDIGGDDQRIHSVKTRYANISFKHILLPVWLSAYRYHEKVYRFLVNARTGEVQGERPYSWVKITLAVIVVIVLAVAGFIGYQSLQQG